jgi:acyl-CoA synthetase (AMP-forming)/AMP-acid ligase II
LLYPATRGGFQTLLDALTLRPEPVSNPGRPALIYLETGRPAQNISRPDFRRTVLAYGAGLQALGLRPGELVIIAHTQNLESIYTFWGALLVGAIPSMFPTLTEKLDASIYMENMKELVRLSGVAAVLTSDEFAPQLRGRLSCPVYTSADLTAAIVENDTAAFRPYAAPPEEIAFLQHSSGTTGLQKGVALTHEAVLNQLAAYGQAIALNPRDVIVSWLPLYHDMGLIAGFILPLVQGIPLVLMSPFDWVRHPAMLFRAIHDYQGTLCWLPNFAYNHSARRIRERDLEALSAASMRLFVNCSEPVYQESHQLFIERFSSLGIRPEMLTVSYAMAENTFAVTQTPGSQTPVLDIINRARLEEELLAAPVAFDHPEAITKVSCGRPIDGTELRIVDDGGRPLPERRVGEVAIRSDCMLDEYYRRPDLQPFQDGWYLTGDRGYIAAGELFIVGRSKDLIINAGKNIYPQDIEAIVNEVPGVHAGRAVAFGVPDEREGTELIAVIAETKDKTLLADQERRQALIRQIRQEVARQSMVTLSYLKLVDAKWLVKTSSGKIARAANRAKWLSEQGRR